MTCRPITALFILATLTRAAAADVDAYIQQAESLRDYLSKALDVRFPVDGCKPGSDAERAACADFVRWHQLAEAEAVLTPARQWLYFLGQIDLATNDVENAGKLVDASTRCDREIMRLLAAGMPTDVTIRIGNSEPIELAMRDAKKQVCEPLARRARTFAKDVETARQQREAAIAAPYRKAGIDGDRLQLLVDHADYPMYGVGGGELATPNQLKRASVIFELLGPGTDGLFILRRYQFRGDTLVATTSGDYVVRPGTRAYR